MLSKNSKEEPFQEIDFQTWLSASLESSTETSAMVIWDLYLKSFHFRRMIFEHSKPSLSQLIQAEHHLHLALEKHLQSLKPKIESYFYQRKQEFELLCSRVETVPLEHLKDLYHYLHEFRYLKRLFAKIYQKEDHFENDLVNEIFNFAEIEVFQKALSQKELSDRFANLYQNALEKQVQFFQKELSLAIGMDHATIEQKQQQRMEIWGLWIWGGELAINISVSDIIYKTNLQSNFKQVRNQLVLWLERDFENLPQKERSLLLESRAWSLYNQINDLMTQVDHSVLSFAQAKISNIYEDAYWFLGILRRYANKSEDESKLWTAYQKLSRLNQLVKAELQDKYLQERLEDFFGEKVILYFEKLIFFLIFFVLFLLFVEYFMIDRDNLQARKIFAIVDTAVCSVFLFEFFLKLGFVNEKWFYFKRRWFIDLLPSIPFILITDFLFLDYVQVGAIAKLGQISRFIRYINIIRPFIRIIRLVSFSLRGLDRLVRKYSKVLNQNLIFFESNQDIHRMPSKQATLESQRVYGICMDQILRSQQSFQPQQVEPIISFYLPQLQALLSEQKGLNLKNPHAGIDKMSELDMPVEEAIHHLLHLQGTQIDSYLGKDFSIYLYKTLGFLDIPFLKDLPWVKKFLFKHAHSSPSEISAWLVRNIAKILELMMNFGYWLADLYGIISGPRLIDKVGSTLVKTFERPAKRMIMFGVIFAIAYIMALSFNIPYIQGFLKVISHFLGIPAIVLGSICLVPLLVGNWLKGIAGEATELYRVTSEAQFINLLEDVKTDYTEEDLTFLYMRVLHLEKSLKHNPKIALLPILTPFKFDQNPVLMKNLSLDEHDQTLLAHFNHHLIQRLQTRHIPEKYRDEWLSDENHRLDTFENILQLSPYQKELLTWIEDKISYLYRDYLDGSILHYSDIKTTEQLLGNLNMRNVLYYRMKLSKKEKQHIEKVDLHNHRSFLGPYLWFSLITQSINHNTAQLILDYNRFVLKLENRKLLSDKLQNLFEDWKTEKQSNQFSAELAKERKSDHYLFQSSDFNSLSFLDHDDLLEKEIAHKYGPDILNILKEDRKLLIRGIFSSYPLHALPKPLRTLNPYQLYQEYLFGSRIFILPFRLIYDAYSLVKMALKWVLKKIHEIQHPEEVQDRPVPQNDFSVVLRKIDRMRKPIFFRMMEIRAKFDFEYLGIHLFSQSEIEAFIKPSISENITMKAHDGNHGNHSNDDNDDNDDTDQFQEDQFQSNLYEKTEDLAIFEEDLKYIHAIEYEQSTFYKIKQQRLDQLKDCLKLLSKLGILDQNHSIDTFIETHYPDLKDQAPEILRNLCIAYSIDYQRLMSIHQILNHFTQVLKDSQVNRSNTAQAKINATHHDEDQKHKQKRKLKLHKKLLINGERLANIVINIGEDEEKKGFNQFWHMLKTLPECEFADQKEYRILWETYLSTYRVYKPILCEFSKEPLPNLMDLLKNIIIELDRWNEELLVVRTLQSLAVLDIQNYRRHLWKIGDYEKDHQKQQKPI